MVEHSPEQQRVGPGPDELSDGSLMLLEQHSDMGILLLEPHRGRVKALPSFHQMFPLAKIRALGDLQQLVHPEDAPLFSGFLDTLKGTQPPHPVELRLQTSADTYTWHLLRGFLRPGPGSPWLPWGNQGKPEAVLFLDDIHAHKDAEIQQRHALAQSEQLLSELNVLNELGQALTTRITLREVYEETYQQASRLLDTSNFFIALHMPDKGEIHFVYDVTDSEQDKNELTIVPDTRGVAGYIIRSREPVLIKDSYTRWTQEHGITTLGAPALSWLGVPMMIGDRVLGVIALQNYQHAGLYDEHSLELLTAIANPTAIAIQNARLFEDRQKSEQEIQQKSSLINELVAPMLSSIEETTALTLEKKQTLEQLSSMTQETHRKLAESDANIKQVAMNVDDMMNMVGLIGSISTTVNLLALNATIEAAHAGRLGRGFAVIASEVRKLSDTTEGQAQDIATALDSMTENAGKSAQASGESLVSFTHTEQIARDILAFLNDVSDRMTQISATSEDILKAMDHSNP